MPRDVEDALLAFLEAAPTLGDCLLINGDLFDFWFAYRRVVPREGFHVVAALAALRRRMPVLLTGGNHDRWGDSFWDRDLGIPFSPGPLRFQVGGLTVEARHGDGIAESHWTARVLHRVTRHPLTIAAYRFLHPDLGFWLVGRLSPRLADSTRADAVLDRAAARQQAWAEARLREDPGLGLLVLGHTHRARVSEPEPGRRYLNPGAWLDGLRYAVATEEAVTLRQFPPPPAPAPLPPVPRLPPT